MFIPQGEQIYPLIFDTMLHHLKIRTLDLEKQKVNHIRFALTFHIFGENMSIIKKLLILKSSISNDCIQEYIETFARESN